MDKIHSIDDLLTMGKYDEVLDILAGIQANKDEDTQYQEWVENELLKDEDPFIGAILHSEE